MEELFVIQNEFTCQCLPCRCVVESVNKRESWRAVCNSLTLISWVCSTSYGGRGEYLIPNSSALRRISVPGSSLSDSS